MTTEKPRRNVHSSLTFAVSRHWIPFRAVRQSRARSALWRAALYAVATLLRLYACLPFLGIALRSSYQC